MNDKKIIKSNEKDSIKVDFHIHTTASDGVWSPQELIDTIIRENISAFAVTDHDSMDNVSETNELAKKHNLAFVPGIEVSTSYEGRNYHILGYGIKEMTSKLQDVCQKNKKTFGIIDSESIRFLAKEHKNISLEDYNAYTHDVRMGGWKAYSYCVKNGVCSSMKEYFKNFIGTVLENPFETYELSSPKEAIEAINSSNGVAILAHPGVPFYHPDIKFVTGYFYSQGIQGFECYHPDNSGAVTQYCLDFCRENNLIITGGSDCHGDFLITRMVGRPDVRLAKVNLLERLGWGEMSSIE